VSTKTLPLSALDLPAERSTPHATRVSGANAGVYWFAAAAWTIPLGQLTKGTLETDSGDAGLRAAPANMESLLTWGRKLLRTGRKKKDLDL